MQTGQVEQQSEALQRVGVLALCQTQEGVILMAERSGQPQRDAVGQGVHSSSSAVERRGAATGSAMRQQLLSDDRSVVVVALHQSALTLQVDQLLLRFEDEVGGVSVTALQHVGRYLACNLLEPHGYPQACRQGVDVGLLPSAGVALSAVTVVFFLVLLGYSNLRFVTSK